MSSSEAQQQSLRQRIEAGETLIADGATGTGLQARGMKRGECSEEWNLSHPDLVADLARSYADAGSDLVYTNTFGGTSLRLAQHGLAVQAGEINRAGVQAAKAGAGVRVLVVGSVGPTGELLEPFGDLTPKQAYAAFSEQIAVLAEAGVDGIVLETFSAKDEMIQALRAARAVAGSLPIIATMSFDTGGRTMMGVTPEDAACFLSEEGALVVGANCSIGPEVVTAVMQKMHAVAPDAHLLAKPNAGLPEMANGHLVYPVTPAMLAPFAVQMRERGISILGGCCGTTPAHIEAMAKALH